MAKKKTPQKGSIAAETDLKKLETYHNIFFGFAIFFMVVGLLLFPFLFVGLFFIMMATQVNKRKKEVLDQQLKAEQIRAKRLQEETEKLLKKQNEQIERELKREEQRRAREFEEAERKERRENLPEEELNRLKGMCTDIYKEYKDLMKKYSKLDDCDSDDFEDVVDENVYILKECYRKLDVARTTIEHYNLQEDVSYDVYGEMVKVMKKAESFINAYIKYQRTENIDDDMIDVMQFTDDLNFIFDYIYEKDEKLNK